MARTNSPRLQAATAGATHPRRKTRRGKGSSARCKAVRGHERAMRVFDHSDAAFDERYAADQSIKRPLGL